jgi:hypothetical protein
MNLPGTANSFLCGAGIKKARLRPQAGSPDEGIFGVARLLHRNVV